MINPKEWNPKIVKQKSTKKAERKKIKVEELIPKEKGKAKGEKENWKWKRGEGKGIIVKKHENRVIEKLKTELLEKRKQKMGKKPLRK